MTGRSTPAAPGPGLATRVFRLAWPVALVVLGAMVLATAWHRWTVSLMFVVAAAVPLLALRGLLRAGLSRWFATSMLLLLVVMGGYLGTTGADLTLEETVQDVVPRLLTSPQPYAVQADLLVGPLLLTALVSLLVGLRVHSRHRVEPVLGAAVLYVAGALLTAGAADPWGLVAVLLLVVAIIGWVFLDEHAEPARVRLSMAGPVAVVGVGALAALATLPVGNAFEPRDLVEPPTYDVVASNPLTQLGAWANNPTDELLRVRGEEVPLRLVVLDRYDGLQWLSATRFEALPDDGRTGLETGRYARPTTVQVEFARLGGSWLPSPGAPSSVALPDALLDRGTGSLYASTDTAGVVYEVSGSYDAPPQAELDAAQLPEGGTERLTDLPPLTNALADFAQRVGSGADTPYLRAARIEALVREKYELSPTAISGSALWRIERFLLGTPDQPGGGVGTSEQFATAFALLARANGLPTRVVVGFRPGETQDDGTRLVRGEDAFAWAEVYFRDLGWVPFSPTPDDDTFRRPQPVQAQEPVLPEEAATAVPTAEPSSGPSSGAPGAEADADPVAAVSAGGGPAGPDAYVVALAALVALVLLLAGLRGGRRLRHARRGAQGAWAEVVDALHLSGLRPPARAPADVVAADVDARLGTAAAAPIAARAQWAAFGPDAPSDADTRAQLGEVRRAARRTLPPWRRWWWHLDPRVLVRRR